MGLLDRMDHRKGEEKNVGASVQTAVSSEESAKAEPVKEKDPYRDIKRKIHSDIIREMNKTGQAITDRNLIGVEFSRVCNEIRYGATLDEALENMVNRIKSPDLMLVVSAVCIQRTTGGNLSEILTTISNTIRDRLKIKGEIRSITAQGRTSGLIIGALPAFIAVALMLINPSYMSTFFTTSTGRIMLIVCVVMEIFGFLAIRKVVTVKY